MKFCQLILYLSVLDPCRNRLDLDGLRQVGNEPLLFIIDAAKDLAQRIRDCGHFEPNSFCLLTTTADENYRVAQVVMENLLLT